MFPYELIMLILLTIVVMIVMILTSIPDGLNVLML